MKRFPGRADIDVEVRGPALQKHHPAAPIVLCLLAAALFLAGASAARSFGTPRNLAAPRITGEAKVGSRLSASHGHWAGHPRSFRYAWHRCNKGRKCVKVGRASKRTYVVNSTDVGHRLRVVVIAANGDGMAQARSVWSKPVKKRDHGRPPPPPPPPGAPAPMPVISRGKPAYASSAQEAASHANDASYSTYWRSNGRAWLAYDLSSVPAANRGQVVVGWYNDPVTSPYDHAVSGQLGYNNLGSYTIQLNPAAGGGRPPANGWVTVASVTNNRYHSRQHLVNMTGGNWIRINITTIDGSSGNNDAVINLDVQDAGADGASDSWMFYGDSITQDGMAHKPVSGSKAPNFSQLINSALPEYFPAAEDGGIGGLLSADGASHMNTWLPLFPGRFVGLAYGTNDANGCISPTAFYDNYVTMVQAVLSAGKVPLVPTIPWARTQNVGNCGPGLNAKIQLLYQNFPQVVHGPDLWGFFITHQNLISGDNLHPSAAGYIAYRQQWADAMVANVYGP